jgi:hypothetical protein
MFKPSNHFITLPLILALGGVSGFALATPPERAPASAQKGPNHIYTGQSQTPGQSGNTDGAEAKQIVDQARNARKDLWKSVCTKNNKVNADGSQDHCQ